MDSGLSAADVMAMTKDNGMADWCNNPFIYLVWLALLGGGGIFGGWGESFWKLFYRIHKFRCYCKWYRF